LDDRIVKLFPVFLELPDDVRKAIFSIGAVTRYQAGTLFGNNEKLCPIVPLVISGALRVYISSEEGREVTLYRAKPGDCCLSGIACRMKAGALPALVEVEQDSEIFMIPAPAYERYLEPNAMWNRFMFASIYERMYDTIMTFEGMIFSRVDRRLAQYLLEKSGGKPATLYITHEQLALQLNTAREVVSRLMAELKRRELVTYERGKVRIINMEGLKNLVSST
jgi:CRP/FNR family transcriptional regulator